MSGQTRHKVIVLCPTFNHAPYIVQAMDGFCMQQTSFPFVCTIIDDASIDGEQDVIAQYLQAHFSVEQTEETADYRLAFARHKENANCHFAVLLLKYNHFTAKKSTLPYMSRWYDSADYMAMCEGDDSWTEPRKLQLQADVLDANPRAVMAFTNFRIVDADGKPTKRPIIELFHKHSHSGDNLPTLLRRGNYVMTLTTMYRNRIWQTEAYQSCPHHWLDFSRTMAAALMGDFIWLPEATASYRSLDSGLIRSKKLVIRQMVRDVYHHYALMIVTGKCKKLSFAEAVRVRILILMRSFKKKDSRLRESVLHADLLSRLLMPVAFVIWKMRKLKKFI